MLPLTLTEHIDFLLWNVDISQVSPIRLDFYKKPHSGLGSSRKMFFHLYLRVNFKATIRNNGFMKLSFVLLYMQNNIELKFFIKLLKFDNQLL